MLAPEVRAFYEEAKLEAAAGGDFGNRLRCTDAYVRLRREYRNVDEVIDQAARSVHPLGLFRLRIADAMHAYFRHSLYSHAAAVFEFEDGAATALRLALTDEEMESELAALRAVYDDDELAAEAARVTKQVVRELRLRDIRMAIADHRGPMHLPWFVHEARARYKNAHLEPRGDVRVGVPGYDGWTFAKGGGVN
jgi:hypothetical protein